MLPSNISSIPVTDNLFPNKTLKDLVEEYITDDIIDFTCEVNRQGIKSFVAKTKYDVYTFVAGAHLDVLVKNEL